ncbi:hypothetical protein [Halobacteriovorax marinus]|uniref:hypothetical protein n=1 Tax=Halobacteriovorax marinus TaxID=97084 RepID=UPI003A94E888
MLRVYVFISTASLMFCVATNALSRLGYTEVSSYFVLILSLGFGYIDMIDQRYFKWVKARGPLVKILLFIPIPLMLYSTKFNF